MKNIKSKSKRYQKLFKEKNDKQLSAVDAIKLIKKQGPTEKARTILQEASDELAKAGSMVQMIACSEFSLLTIDEIAVSGVEVIDTINVLVERIVIHATS